MNRAVSLAIAFVAFNVERGSDLHAAMPLLATYYPEVGI
jgi:hypothetical protein